jgi:nitrogen fixation protein FixH
MKLAFALAATLTLGSFQMLPAFAATPGTLSMAVQLSPSPAKQGTETLTVRLNDAQHRPVNGANVSIASSMPTMSMTGPTVRAASKGNGVYVATINLNFATRWAFTAVAQAGGKTVKRVLQVDVK